MMTDLLLRLFPAFKHHGNQIAPAISAHPFFHNDVPNALMKLEG